MEPKFEQDRNHNRIFLLGAAMLGVVLLVTFFRAPADNKKAPDPILDAPNTPALNPDKQISPQELLKKTSDLNNSTVMILDLRNALEFQAEHILDAKNISSDQLASTLTSLDKSKTFTLMSERTFTAEEERYFSDLFQKNGISSLLFLTGGFAQWKSEFLPVVAAGDPNSFTDQSKVTYIKSDALKDLLVSNTNLFLIDLRSSDQFKAGHLKNATNFYLDDLEKLRSTIPAGKKIVLYDKDGLWAFKGAVRLFDMGFFNVVALSDGFETWKQKGFEVVQ